MAIGKKFWKFSSQFCWHSCNLLCFSILFSSCRRESSFWHVFFSISQWAQQAELGRIIMGPRLQRYITKYPTHNSSEQVCLLRILISYLFSDLWKYLFVKMRNMLQLKLYQDNQIIPESGSIPGGWSKDIIRVPF